MNVTLQTETGIVFDVKRYSIHDGPGIRTTVFFKGCPLSCSWCQNPEGQSPRMEIFYQENRCINCGACLDACDQDAISWKSGVPVTDSTKCVQCGTCASTCYAEARELVGRKMTVLEVIAELERDIPFYNESKGGATFSGGEPLLQSEFLLALLKACKDRGIHTALDTCGCATWKIVESIREHVDLFLYDLKLPDDKRHREYTGVSNKQILKNLQKLSGLGHTIIARVPVIPGINDNEDTMRQIGEYAASLPSLDGVDLLPYHHLGRSKYARLGKMYHLEAVDSLPAAKALEIACLLQEYGVRVTISS